MCVTCLSCQWEEATPYFGWYKSRHGFGHQIQKAIQYRMVVAKKKIYENLKSWMSELSSTLHLERHTLSDSTTGFEAT